MCILHTKCFAKGLEIYTKLILYFKIKHTRVDTSTTRQRSELILITRHIPSAILASCRDIHGEASSIVQRLMHNFILAHNPRLIMHASCHKQIADILREIASQPIMANVGT